MKKISLYLSVAFLSLSGIAGASVPASEGSMPETRQDFSKVELDESAPDGFVKFLRDNMTKSSKLGFANSSTSCGDFKSFIQKFTKGFAGPGTKCRELACSTFCVQRPTEGTARKNVCENICIRGVPMAERAHTVMQGFYPQSSEELKKYWEGLEGLSENSLFGKKLAENRREAVQSLALIQAQLKNAKQAKVSDRAGDKQKAELIDALAELNIQYLIFKRLVDQVSAAAAPLKAATEAVVKQYKDALDTNVINDGDKNNLEQQGRKKALSRKSPFSFSKNKPENSLNEFTLDSVLSHGTETAENINYYHTLVESALSALGHPAEGHMMDTEVTAMPSPSPLPPAAGTVDTSGVLSQLQVIITNNGWKNQKIRTGLENQLAVSQNRNVLLEIIKESKDQKISTKAAYLLARINGIPS